MIMLRYIDIKLFLIKVMRNRFHILSKYLYIYMLLYG